MAKLDLEQIVRDLDATNALDGLQLVIFALRDAFAVDHAVYHWVDSLGDQYGCGTYSDEWVALYTDQNFLRVDPVVSGCFQRFHPVDWKRLDWSSKASREFLAQALTYGVGNQGYSIPIRGPNGQFAMFTVSHHCDDETWAGFIDEYNSDLILIAHYFHRKAMEFQPGRQSDQSRALSPREVDVLTLLATGYSRAQIADTLSISQNTLRVYLESARFKLGALNTTHAVARALSRGMIVV